MTSPGARYSAGTAFLDVVPSFRGVQEAIRKKTQEMEKALGKEAGEQFGKSFEEGATRAVDRALGTTRARETEKQGREAGQKYAGAFSNELKKAIAGASREVKASLKFTSDDKDLNRNLKAIEARLKTLGKAKIGIDVSAGDALREIETIRAAMAVLQEHAKTIDVKVNTAEAFRALDRAQKRIDSIKDVEIDVKVNDRALGRFESTIKQRIQAATKGIGDVAFNAVVDVNTSKLQALKAELAALSDKTIGVDIGAKEALDDLARIRATLQALANDTTAKVNVRADAAAAASELAGVKTLVDLIDGQKAKVEVKVDVDRSFAQRIQALRNQLLGADADGRSAADGFRAFNAMVLTGAAVLPSVVPVIAALAGGLALIGPLAVGAGAGLAVMGIAFSGVGEAVQAMGKVQDNAGKDAEAAAKRIRNASRSVEDAERAVGRARENAAQQAADAARAVEDAVQNQRDAEENLADAQRDVQRAQEDLTRAREEAAEQLEDLNLQIRGGALVERDAILDLKEAEDNLRAGREGGASGDDLERLILKVDQARFRLDQTRESNEDLRLESEEWARTGVEGSERVVAAQERVQAAQRGVGDAQRAVADAARGVQDAIQNQQQVARDGARAIEDAQRNLIQAQEDYTTAVNETSASQQALEVAMGKLGPAGQAFATYIASVLPAFRELRDIAQAGILPGVQEAIDNILTNNGPLLRDFMAGMGTVIGDLFRSFGDLMTSPQWQGIWAVFNQYAPIFMQQFGEMAMAMLTFFGELFVALAPYAERFGEALIRAAEGAAAWAASLKDSEGFRETMEWLFEYGPIIWEDLKDIFLAVKDLFIALLPLGLIVLDALAGVARFINSLDPEVLGAIVTTMIGLVIAFQLASGAIALLAGAMAIASVPISAIIFAIVAIGIALGALYLYSEDFRNFVDNVFGALADVVSYLWETAIKPAFDALMEALPGIWTELQRLWEIAEPIFVAMGTVMATVVGIWLSVWNGVLNALEPILGGIARMIEGFLQFVRGVIDFFAGLFTGDWTRMMEGIEDIVGGTLGAIWGLFETVFGGIYNFARGFIEGIINFFAWLYDVLVGNSIVPDLVNAIVFWFDLLFGTVIDLVGLLVNGAVALFQFWWDFTVLVFQGMMWAWDNILRPTWDAIIVAAQWLWNNILQPIFAGIADNWRTMAEGMRWIYENVIRPWIIEPFMALVSGLGTVFDEAVQAIKTAWERLQNFLARPINFVIKYVLNEGLFGAFNWVVDKLGLPDDWMITPWNQVGDPSTHFAAGGRVPGWSPNDKADNIPAMLTAGEYVHPVDAVNYYGADTMELIRKKKIPREELEGLRYYATGGFVKSRRRDEALPVYMQSSNVAGQPDQAILPAHLATAGQLFSVIKGSFPRAKLNSSFRPGDPGYHGRNMAVDLGEEGFAGGAGRPYLAAMNRWIHDVFGAQTTELIYTGLGDDRPDLKNGRPLNYGASTNAQHRNHVHWAMVGPINTALAGGPPAPGGAEAVSGGRAVIDEQGFFEWAWNGISGAAKWVWNTVTGPLDHIKNAIVEPLRNFGRDFGDNALVKIVSGLPGKMVDNVWEKIKDVVTSIFGTYSSAETLAEANAAGANAAPGDLEAIVKAAFAGKGWNQGNEWNAVANIIQRESGWNPRAQNPNSTASGLFQHINATWNRYKASYVTATRMRDAGINEQAYAGMRYIEDRYGSPSAAWRYWQANNHYAEGGEVTGDSAQSGGSPTEAPTLYDTGGWLPPGITTVLNASNKPEPVLTAGMWEELVNARSGDDDDRAYGIEQLHLHEVNADLSQAIDRVNHEVRKMQRGGRYAGAGTGGN